MARLRVSYQDPDGRGHYLQFFENFIVNLELKQNKGIWQTVYEHLYDVYGATIIKSAPGIMYVEFPDERDITMFLLRWS